MGRTPDDHNGLGCLALIALGALLLVPLAIAPLWGYSATWTWWPAALVLLALTVLLMPVWPYNRRAAYRHYPAGTLGLLTIVLVVLLLVGVL